jgi:membrane protease subunit HflC
LAVAVLVLLYGSASSCFSVDRTEYVYVTQFGKPVVTYDGANEAGLHFKLPWPIQSVLRLDHRLHVFDLAGAELLTHDPKGKTIDKTLTISAYVCWRIPDALGVDQFIRSVGTPERAEAILGQQISSRLGAAIGNMKLDDLISTSKSVEERMDRLSQRLLDESDPGRKDSTVGLRTEVKQTYGIEIVDIRLRRFNYPVQVREDIFNRIRSERNKKVADYQSEGEQLAKKIRSEAEYEERVLLADARAHEQRVRGQAEADADRIRNRAQSKDVAFYAFLKKLEQYQRILGDNKSMLLLSAHRDLFDTLLHPPNPERNAPKSNGNGPGITLQPGKPGGP